MGVVKVTWEDLERERVYIITFEILKLKQNKTKQNKRGQHIQAQSRGRLQMFSPVPRMVKGRGRGDKAKATSKTI